MGISATARARGACVAFGALALALTTMGCGEGSDIADGDRASAPEAVAASKTDMVFWNRLVVSANEVEAFATLEDMAQASDRVVVGVIAEVRMGRTLQGDVPDGQLQFAEMVVSVEDQLTSDTETELVTEFVLPGGTSIDDLASEQPDGTVLMFLHEKADRPDVFRLIMSDGLWVETAEGLVTPLGSEVAYASETAGLDNLAELATYIDGSLA